MGREEDDAAAKAAAAGAGTIRLAAATFSSSSLTRGGGTTTSAAVAAAGTNKNKTKATSTPSSSSDDMMEKKKMMKSNAAGGGPSLAPATDGRAAGQVKDDPDHQDDRKVSSKKKNNKERRSRNKNNNGAGEDEEEDSASDITSEQQRAGAHRIEGSSSVARRGPNHSILPNQETRQAPQAQAASAEGGFIELEAQLVEEDDDKRETKEPPPVLAQATPMEESPAPPAIVEPASKWKKYGTYVAFLVLLGVIGALVAVFVPEAGSSSSSSSSSGNVDNVGGEVGTEEQAPTPTPPPTQTQTPPPTSVFDEMFAFAETISSSSSLSNTTSPQYKAVEWLAQDKVEHGSNWSGYELLQRYVLRVLYHSTDGDNWSGINDASTTWFGAWSVCDWRSINAQCGVCGFGQCNINDQQVGYIALRESHLQGTIPDELGQLTALTRLDLWDNQLTGTIPLALTQLTALEKLYLHNNKLTGQVPAGFCAVPFPDWRSGSYSLYADCISEVQCDCCDRCYDENGNAFCWNGSGFTSNLFEC